MATSRQAETDPETVRSHARGRGFWSILLAPWPIGALGGVVCSLVLGVGMAVGIASGLAIALGLNFIWIGIVFAIDDGDVDDQARGAVAGEDAGREAPRGHDGSRRAPGGGRTRADAAPREGG